MYCKNCVLVRFLKSMRRKQRDELARMLWYLRRQKRLEF